MELLQLKYFQVAAKIQNFSQAAEQLNITQPSLSITISHLEDELNAKLFDRKGRNIELNEVGLAFLDRVNRVFCELESAKNEIIDITGKQSNHISLITTNPRLLSGVLKQYLMLHSNVVINQKCEIYKIAEKQCQSAGFSPRIAFEVDGVLMEEMLELERGIALLPLYLIKRPHFGTRNLSMLKIEEPDTRISIGLSWLKSKHLSHTSRCFREYLIENYSNYLL